MTTLIPKGAACFLITLLLGCGGSTGTDVLPLESSGDFAVTVSSGTTPTFSWSGGNALNVSVVKFDATASASWDATATDSKGIASPVTFGSTPPNTVRTHPNILPLTSGTHYLVSVVRLDGRSGVQEFVP